MYKITHFDKKLCHLLRHHLDLVEDNICEIYSIWNFWPGTRWKSLKNLYAGKYLCRAHNFPIIYWLVLIISVVGSAHSFLEFTSLYWSGRKQITVWRQRTFYVLPPSVLRKCRMIGALIMLMAWLLLWYAVVKVSPTHMTPWIAINTFFLSSDLIVWLVEMFSGFCKLKCYTLFSFALAWVNYAFVRCVQSVFINAIEMDELEYLRLWKT